MKLNERQACQILGLASPTTIDDARKAYRKLARELHPDRGGDEERFKKVSVAYQYLVDYYEDQPRGQRAARRPAQSRKANTRSTSSAQASKSSARSKTSSSRSSKSQKSSKRGGAKASDDAHNDDTANRQEDHRQAWRAWREQVDRSAHEGTKERRQSDQGDRYEGNHKASAQSSAQSSERPSSQSSAEPSDQHHEVVEASVVPGLGDTLKRWGETVGDRVSLASNEIGDRFNRWYRKSARSLFERGQDEKLKLNIDLTTALHGKQVRIAVQRLIACPECQHESGRLKVDPNTPAAQWAEGCTRCDELGRINHREELSVYVPPGGDKGDKLKVNEKGSEGLNGAPSGHLYLLITPAPLPQGFRRNGADVELTQLVSADLLNRGGVLTLKTLRGELNIRVPQNFRSGKKLMVPDQGFPLWSDPTQLGKLTICLKAISP